MLIRIHCRNMTAIVDTAPIHLLTCCFTETFTHQVISASLEQGVREGRMLLHDWLVILVAQYNDACKLVQYDHGNSTTARIDVTFSQCPQLQPFPRLVFALLRNPLLRFHEEGVHPDYRIYLQCLLRYMMFTLLSILIYIGRTTVWCHLFLEAVCITLAQYLIDSLL